MLVLIPTKLSTVAKGILEEAGYEVVQDASGDLAGLAAKYPHADGMIVRSEKVTAEVIDSFPQLKVIVRAGAGYNTIDTKYARSKDIAVMNTPGANSNAVAEEVVGLMLAGCRNFIQGDVSTRSGGWEKGSLMGTELTGKKVGILGFGNIGQLVAKRLKGFEVDILIYDPYVSKDKAKEFGVTIATTQEIFAECDFITLHMPATDETANMINKDLFSLMKDGSVLVNCARAEILDEADLREAKKGKKIIFCNDVYMKDAPGEKSCADVSEIMLPHLGASTIEANTNAAVKAANQLIGYLERGITTFVVNKAVPDGLEPMFQQLAFVIGRTARGYLGSSSAPHEIQCSFYGSLNEFNKWLIPSVVAGITNDKGINDFNAAETYLQEKGIELKIRETDESKNYGDSITVDLLQESGTLARVSVRGTLTEGNVIISRIDDFDKLYFEPSGHSVIFNYEDRPGVIAQITQILADEGLNIDDIRSPHNAKGNRSIAVLKVNKAVSQETIEKIKAKLNCEVGFHLHI
ncbi:MAG: ACT domain-containing protein [Lentisphaeraceae bacterium]|nr:ACT domain-containing protein [Lentisphaeraceae bacterium]